MMPCHVRVQRGASAWATLATVAAVAATLALGRWQLQRAAEKTVLQQQLQARQQQVALDLSQAAAQAMATADSRFRRAVAQGHYDAAHQIFIDNREDQGRPGFHVLTPLRLGTKVVLVNRGFVPRDRNYPKPPDVPVETGAVRVEGLLVPAQTRYVELSKQVVDGVVWQNLDLGRYANSSGLDVLPVVLLAQHASAGLQPVVERPSLNIAMHQGYAFQWFSLAATAVLLYVYFTFLRKAPSSS